jgi:alpha-glucoside transport system substrate-binding protein
MRHTKKFVAMAMASAMVLAACGGDDGESSDTTAAGGEGGSGESILDGAIECNQQHAGKEVTVFSPVRDSETDTPIADYVAAYKPLEDCTGLKIVWQGTDQFETEINVRLEGGDAPDVIDFPQPGLMASLVAKGYLFELDEDLVNRVNNDFFAGWDVYSKVDDKVYGIPGRSNI